MIIIHFMTSCFSLDKQGPKDYNFSILHSKV